MTNFEKMMNIKTIDEAVGFLENYNSPNGLESTRCCIDCEDRERGCFKPACKTKLILKYLESSMGKEDNRYL